MSNTPKEQLTAYQRWEMAAFDENGNSSNTKGGTQGADELAAITEKARREGYTKGLSEGFQNGHSEGLATALAEGKIQVDNTIAQLTTLLNNLNDEIALADLAISADLLALALDIAQAMIRTALNVQPDLVIPVISEAIHDLPNLQQHSKIFLHPSDAAIVKSHLSNEPHHWRIIEDDEITPGGCRIDTQSNQIDATMQGRWQRIAKNLNVNSHWLNKPPEETVDADPTATLKK
ncbi:flagellar assembly protein FliH [Sulfuriferula nivalis]|uniref:Flagellar assembly protein FliH n=1 Tax=Sulfuriferula nivalis TaxID=2675298 RepID=A0A809S9X5_9PROT|nr:flagellar assembly protein FliH [Sulfuriferula nivalis]BBP01212.1 flagellar assembly protein H [Sulfuriferula nivalis]